MFNIRPIHKKGDRKDISNYRSLKLTSVKCGIFEVTFKMPISFVFVKHGQFHLSACFSTRSVLSLPSTATMMTATTATTVTMTIAMTAMMDVDATKLRAARA